MMLSAEQRRRASPSRRGPRYPDLTGQLFTRLRVLELAAVPLPTDAPVLGTTSGRSRPRWRCRCTCREDKEIIVYVCTYDLTAKRVRSCGCLRVEGARKARRTVTAVILNIPHEQAAAWRAAAGKRDVQDWLADVADQAAAAAGFAVPEPPEPPEPPASPSDGKSITIAGRTYFAPPDLAPGSKRAAAAAAVPSSPP